jgi:tripartite-type tricarboxylate transporter receptor subunit TctC
MLGGQTQVMFATVSSAIEYVKAGKLRALAVTSKSRLDILPDIPTVAETVPGFEVTSWTGLGAPKGTSAEIINKLNKEINTALVDPNMKARFAQFGGTALPGSPADFTKFIGEETEKWGKVIRAAGIKAE